jgi:hypothetical protein
MAEGFSPSVENARAQGVRVVRMPFPPGVAGVKLSLEAIAQRIREGANDPAVMGWAMDRLREAGIDGRGFNDTAFAKMRVLLDAVRAWTVYTPDPPHSETIKSAAAMLCLAPGLCVRGGDCDDQVVLLGSVLMSVGIPVLVVKQTFGSGDQEHVLIRAQDDSANWVALDPSTNLPAGESARASSEFALDPMNPSMIGLTGVPEAEFIGIGALPKGYHLVGARVRGLPTRRVGDATVTAIPAVSPLTDALTTAAAWGILAAIGWKLVGR